MQKLFSFGVQSHLFIFAFVACAFGVISKKIVVKTNVKQHFPYVLFQEFYGFRYYIQVFNPILVNFSECCKTWEQFHSSACDNPAFPTSFTEEIIPSPLSILGSFVKYQLTDLQAFTYWLLFLIHVLCVYFYASTILFCYL